MTKPSRPNVLVFFTDQQRWDTTGLAGSPVGLTPNLDQLGRSGAYFDVAVTAQPVCAPSRAALQTGRFASAAGVWRNGLPLDPSEDTLAKSFAGHGYETAYVGKWHLGDPSERGPVPPQLRGGYEYWMAANALEHTSDAYHTTLWDGDGVPHFVPGYRVDAVTDVAIDFLRERESERPFLLFVSLLEPHHQNQRDDFPAPDVYASSYHGAWMPPDLVALGGNAAQSIGGYYGMIRRIDEAFGRVVDTLKSMNALDDTLVVFASDHGCHFKTRNWEYKRSIHDASVRVPLLIAGPGVVRGRFVSDVVSLVDLAPTLLSLSGLTPPERMQGRDLSQLMRDADPDWEGEAFIQVSESEVGRAIRTRRWKYGVVAPDADPLRDSSASVYRDAYLYDLMADPYELRNLAGLASHQVVASQLRERLHRWMDRAGEPPRTILPAEAESQVHSQLHVDDRDLPGALGAEAGGR